MSKLARCHSACARGIEGQRTEVEVSGREGQPRFEIVGLPDAAGREARDRVRTAILNSGYPFPDGIVLVNLAPAGTPKTGAGHDLPIALAVLATIGVVPRAALARVLVFGELSLDGRVRAVRGAFLLASAAQRRGVREVLAPDTNAAEAALATEVPVLPIERLSDAVLHLNGMARIVPADTRRARTRPRLMGDFADVRGQETVKTALIVAAAGGHNVLLVGPPGCGKTLVAERFPDLLPDLAREEALEVARLRSAAGLRVDGLPQRRPFRAPSCGASAAGVLGGGRPPGPGEVSLAHRGVLFLDETPHFRGDVLEGLRGPLEDGRVTLSRAGTHLTLPARFLLIAAMNPCPCGHAGSSECGCTPVVRQRYLRRLSGPLLDRIDLRVMVRAVPFEKLRGSERGKDTAQMREEVFAARAVQATRLGPGRMNSSLTTDEIERYCRPRADAEAALADACNSGKLSARGVVRVLRVARTLADVAGRTGPELSLEEVRTAAGWRVDRTG